MNIDMGYTFVNIVNTITILFMVMGDVAGYGRAGGSRNGRRSRLRRCCGLRGGGVLGGGGLTGRRGGCMLRGVDSRWRGMGGAGRRLDLILED